MFLRSDSRANPLLNEHNLLQSLEPVSGAIEHIGHRDALEDRCIRAVVSCRQFMEQLYRRVSLE